MKQPSITSLPSSPEEERRGRMIKYSIAMGIRVICVVLMLFVRDWWLIVVAAGAIFLPYVAVVLANASGPKQQSRVLRPGGLVRAPHEDPPAAPSHPDDEGSRAA